MILITGATGHYGSNTINHLLQKGINPSKISALVRDASKAKELQEKGIEIKTGDYTDYSSLTQAFTGVDKLLLVSSNDRQSVENRTAHHINVIKAAQKAGVKHVVYTSFVRKPNYENTAIAAFQNSHVQSEDFLKNSGMDYTILQNGMYLEMIPIFVGNKIAETGVINFPAGNGKASYVMRDELAEAAAHILTTEGHENKVYQLTNNTSLSFDDIAAVFSAIFGKDILYQSPSIEAFETGLKAAGVPDLYIGMFTMWAEALAQGAMDVEDNTLARFLGREPNTLGNLLKGFYTEN